MVSEIRNILKGDIKDLINALEKKMMFFSEKLDFENAQKIKEKITLLNNYQFSICSEKNFSFVNYLKITNGAVVLSHTVEVKKKLEEQDHDILQFVITELRKRFNSVSNTIYCSIPIDNVWNNSKLLIPKIGDKKKLIDLSLRNAKYMQLEKKKV